MLDIKFIRDNRDLIAEAARKKRVDFNVGDLIAVDDERRALIETVEDKRAQQNNTSHKIALRETPETERERLIALMRALKEELSREEERLKDATRRFQRLMLQVPNIPDMSVPEGKDDAENKEIHQWGEKPDFDSWSSRKPAKDHIELMRDLGLADFDRGTKIAGFRGYVLTGDGARLSFALWQFAFEFFSAKGFVFALPPVLPKREAFLGTGYLPQGEEDLYRTQDGAYLAGTAEVPTMAYYMDETLDAAVLPLKFLSFSPCYRREAGSYGKDTKGLFRVHEFYKFEQVVLCEANHETSVREHEWLNRNTEEFIERLGVPYRTVVNCGGDLGLGQVKKYDIELWVPSENRYREISSASYFHDFQTRRLNIRYRGEDGKLRFAHSLNATAVPTPRLLVALVENNQQQDGSVMVPEALEKYMGKKFLGADAR